MKSRLGTSWVVGTPISKGVFRRIDLGILDGEPIGLGRAPGGGARGCCWCFEYNECDTHAVATCAAVAACADRLARFICELLRFTLQSRYLLLRIPEFRLRGILFTDGHRVANFSCRRLLFSQFTFLSKPHFNADAYTGCRWLSPLGSHCQRYSRII